MKYDLPADLSVFLVALPLCLGIALASGAPLYSGILSGIIGGIVVSLISGSQLALSGPAAGLSTVACGVLGAIPMTAVIVRGAANIDAGARTKLSAFTHGFFLLLAVAAIPFALNKIPNASLAAILLVTGYNLTKPKLYRSMWQLGWETIPAICFNHRGYSCN
ncbi:MAG TPA: SulP family inorganic anion transporter [Flavisolibacter sp.]|nr:SulP family inorganic anion transporter [Flavisolibacter sp.]